MSNRWEQSLRNQRKLPSIPPTRRRLAHRGAIDWYQSRHEIVGTALTIAEMHPKLSSSQACDKLCNFVSNRALADSMESDGLSHGGEKENINVKAPGAPTFSVSKVLETGPSPGDYAYVDKLYVCGNVTEEKWSRLVLNLSRNYFVRCSPEQDQDMSEIWVSILQSDAFIFLMDSHSLGSKDCLGQLETAIELNVKIVFIREANLRQPSSLARSVWPTYQKHGKNYHGTTQGDEILTQRSYSSRDHGYTTRSNFLQVRDSHSSVQSDRLQPGTARPNSSLTVPTCRSAPDLHSIGNHTGDTARHRSNGVVTSPPVQHVDLTKVIQDGYNNAVIYETHRHREVAMLLRSMLNKAQHGVEKPSKIFLSTPIPPTEGQTHENSHYEEMDIKVTPEPETQRDIVYDLDSESEPSCQDTVYLIYNENTSEKSPKVFHWPSDCTQEGIPNSPSIDSFGFEDVDLSKSINNLDLSGYLSD